MAAASEEASPESSISERVFTITILQPALKAVRPTLLIANRKSQSWSFQYVHVAVGEWRQSDRNYSAYDGDGWGWSGGLVLRSDGLASIEYSSVSSSSRAGGMLSTDNKETINAAGTWKAISKDGAGLETAECTPEDLVGSTVTLTFTATARCEYQETSCGPTGMSSKPKTTASITIDEVSFVVGSKDGKPSCEVPAGREAGGIKWAAGMLQTDGH